jgi:hypothetical protein
MDVDRTGLLFKKWAGWSLGKGLNGRGQDRMELWEGVKWTWTGHADRTARIF